METLQIISTQPWPGPTFVTAHPAGHDRFAVLSPPEDLRLRVAAGLAGQVDSLLLPHHEVVRAPPVHDTGRHWDKRTYVNVSQEEEESSPCTSRYPRLLLIGSVLTWHM